MLEFFHGGKRYGKERFFMKIQYFGDPSNPKIVVLHPMLLDGKSMLPLLGELRNSHCVIAPDLTGHGTDTGIFQSAQQEAETLAGWLTTQGWIDLKLVFGASIGGDAVDCHAHIQSSHRSLRGVPPPFQCCFSTDDGDPYVSVKTSESTATSRFVCTADDENLWGDARPYHGAHL